MDKNKSMLITLGITIFLFSFIIFLVYLIYCYAYYDEYQESIYIDKFNINDSRDIYNNLYNEDKLIYEDFMVPYNLMYDKNTLKDIYYLYYKDQGLYSNIDEFIKNFYYGNWKVTENDVSFYSIGKTNLVNRREIMYKSIKLYNAYNEVSSIGVINNLRLKIEDNSEVILDDGVLSCVDNECIIDKIFAGLHVIRYKSNNIDYYGIVNFKMDNQVIEVSLIDSLVKINGNEVIIKEEETPVAINANLNRGIYKLNVCYLEDGCPSKLKSYVTLYEDGRVEYYTYVTLDIAGDTYNGTYTISGNFLILHFDSHIYRVHDYDTKQYTDIEGRVDMEMRFKIENEKTISNDSYQFKYSEEISTE